MAVMSITSDGDVDDGKRFEASPRKAVFSKVDRTDFPEYDEEISASSPLLTLVLPLRPEFMRSMIKTTTESATATFNRKGVDPLIFLVITK